MFWRKPGSVTIESVRSKRCRTCLNPLRHLHRRRQVWRWHCTGTESSKGSGLCTAKQCDAIVTAEKHSWKAQRHETRSMSYVQAV